MIAVEKRTHRIGLPAVGVAFATLVACLPIAALAADRAELAREEREPGAGAELVLRALSMLGVDYRFGGTSPQAGLDCSGLVRHVFGETVGRVLPRRSEDMSRVGEPVAVSQLKPGDLVFFNTLRRAFSHVGIYIGNGQFVHAPSTGGQVRLEALHAQYWSNRFNGARRLLSGDRDSAPADRPVLEQLLASIPVVPVSVPATLARR